MSPAAKLTQQRPSPRSLCQEATKRDIGANLILAAPLRAVFGWLIGRGLVASRVPNRPGYYGLRFSVSTPRRKAA